MDDMRLALILNAISPAIGGVLGPRAKKAQPSRRPSVRSPRFCRRCEVVAGCRFSCSPAAPDPQCPDGPHPPAAAARLRPSRLVELPVGDRRPADRIAGHRTGADRGRDDISARLARRRPPRRALRRRGQPAARPSRRPAARRRCAGHELRGAGRRLGTALRPIPAGRHNEPRGGRAAPAATGPLRSHGGGGRAARTPAAG